MCSENSTRVLLNRLNCDQIGRTVFCRCFEMHSFEKKFLFWFKRHCKWFLWVHLTIYQHWFRWWFDTRQVITWTYADPVQWRIHMSQYRSMLMRFPRSIGYKSLYTTGETRIHAFYTPPRTAVNSVTQPLVVKFVHSYNLWRIMH